MSVRYTADLVVASSVVRSLGLVEVSLEDVICDLRWRVARLHETFEGTAADAHLARHAQWSAAYADMQAALATMRAALATAQSNYQAAVDANLAMWESVR